MEQGSLIGSLEFIVCSQILFLLIRKNPDIRGIFFGNNEIKMSQFVDHITIILDGTQRSLQAALNTIEVFGSFSGLRMNKSKTKLIWIGRKKYSKDNLEINQHLEWEETKLTLLGINFDVDLNNNEYAKLFFLETTAI